MSGPLRDFSFDVSVDGRGRRFRGSANGLEALARERREMVIAEDPNHKLAISFVPNHRR